jgi:hypothetical protein
MSGQSTINKASISFWPLFFHCWEPLRLITTESASSEISVQWKTRVRDRYIPNKLAIEDAGIEAGTKYDISYMVKGKNLEFVCGSAYFYNRACIAVIPHM